ncbi:hypothetical protein ACQCVK_08310 [Rossellomorea vietnamensis]|uniref:hypothetical protein n=1 Tax=Rossellomorea vietnamensis TaxID=218284 RepID=UPI003CF04546
MEQEPLKASVQLNLQRSGAKEASRDPKAFGIALKWCQGSSKKPKVTHPLKKLKNLREYIMSTQHINVRLNR